ncbi:MAG: threonine--tRNA ligase [bacterium]|nr:threonine--tRNA ligase [bacterium]
MEEAENTLKDRDHKKLGKELGLFYIDEEVGKGLPMWLPKGATLRRIIERFVVDEEIKRGYSHVCTPDIAKLSLYEKSGHYPYYKDSMYAPIEIDEDKFMLRPMTCPHHFQMYLSKPRSYRELPMRIAELAKLYRYEQSGELMGLQRTRGFCLADAHIICADEVQAALEIEKALELIEYMAGVFGLENGKNYHFRLSLRSKESNRNYYDDDSGWDRSEALLRDVLNKRGSDFVEAKNEAAFYGPKIDIQMKNVNGKEDTAFTVQYDLCMPKRFGLNYTAEDGKERQAVVVHRSSIGAIERAVAFLIEHFAGAFPFWLSPVQVKVLPVSEKQFEYAKKVFDELKSADIRAELDDSSEGLGKKVRGAKVEKVPYWIVVGEKESSGQTVTLESRQGEKKEILLSELTEHLKNI